MSHEQPVALPAVDFGRTAAEYGQWRQGFPPEFFRRLDSLDIARAGQRILDIGTGTGLLARAFAQRGAVVTGLDPSPAMLDEARRLDAVAGLTIDYVQTSAEATGLPGGMFDVVSAATCWHWFDRPRAAAEARRLLKPDGKLLIAALDWHFTPGNVPDVTWDVVMRHNPVESGEWGTFAYPRWTPDLTGAGFDAWEVFAFTTTLAYTLEAWIGRVRASARVGPVMDAATLQRFEAELRDVLRSRFQQDKLDVDHRVFALIAWTRSLPQSAAGSPDSA
jgi:SAM-dependent methyltransferase